MEKADLLLLPNIGIEGWGAVVSESLSVGTPVLCTENTGAAHYIKKLDKDLVLKNIDQTCIYDIEKILQKIQNMEYNKNEIKDFYNQYLNCEVGAKKLLKIINDVHEY